MSLQRLYFFIGFKYVHNCWLKRSMTAALTSSSDSSNSSVISVLLASVDCLFSSVCGLPGSWYDA